MGYLAIYLFAYYVCVVFEKQAEIGKTGIEKAITGKYRKSKYRKV